MTQIMFETSNVPATVIQAATAPLPPESCKVYSKKSEESNGITAMIVVFITALDKQMTETEVTEKVAQKDYESS